MFIIALLDRIFGRPANAAFAAQLSREKAPALPRIHIVALAPSGATDALAKALETAHFTDTRA